MSSHLGDLFASGLLFFGLSFAAAVALVIAQSRIGQASTPVSAVALLGINGCAGAATWHFLLHGWAILLMLGVGVATPVATSRMLRDFTYAGRLLLVTHAQATLFGLLWGVWLITTAPLSPFTRTLMLTGYPLLFFTLFVGLTQTFEQWEVFCRKNWLRPRLPLSPIPRNHHPKVSLHVPTCSEPPEMVIATLDALACLHYPNFEVLVIDNNTQDPQLWQPLETHCRQLGERFRFFHIDRLSGAKAGALNFALRHTAADAELIGLIDSDYQVAPEFLAALVSYFDDPTMGFVQTPQAYRDWENRSYLAMCNWEYKLVFATTLVSRNERDAAITVGTMGLIRRKALEAVGGWAEWCVTEDSELAVRIHALGYQSLYLNTVFGRGLIPENFAGYKKQRFRWTYGPIQELRRHFRLFLPRPWAQPSALTAAQKIHHLIHGLGALKFGLEFLLLPLGAALMASMLIHHEAIPLPPAMWLIVAVGLAAGLSLRWHIFHTTMGCTFKDMLGALAATAALGHIIRVASLWGIFTRSTPWRRTNKFRALPLGLGALSSASTELLLGIATWILGLLAIAHYRPSGLLLLILIGELLQSIHYFAAPVLALLAEHGIQSCEAPPDSALAGEPAVSPQVRASE